MELSYYARMSVIRDLLGDTSSQAEAKCRVEMFAAFPCVIRYVNYTTLYRIPPIITNRLVSLQISDSVCYNRLVTEVPLDSLYMPGLTQPGTQEPRNPGPPSQDLTPGCKQPSSDNNIIIIPIIMEILQDRRGHKIGMLDN